MEKLSTANSSTEMSVWLLCRSMQGSPGPQLMNMAPPGATRCSTGTGVKVGGGVFVGTGEFVGSGVLVGAGVQVGAGVHVGSGVFVGKGVAVAVGCGVLVGGGVSVGAGVGVSVGSWAYTLRKFRYSRSVQPAAGTGYPNDESRFRVLGVRTVSWG